MSTTTVKRAAVVAALVCGAASAAGYYWYKKRKNRYRKRSNSSKSSSSKSPMNQATNRQNSSTRSKNEQQKPIRQSSNNVDETGLSKNINNGGDDSDFENVSSSCDEHDGGAGDLKLRGRKQYRMKSKSKTATDRNNEEKVKMIDGAQQQQQPKREATAAAMTNGESIMTNGTTSMNKKKEERNILWSDEVEERSASTESSEPEIAASAASMTNGLGKSPMVNGQRMVNGGSASSMQSGRNQVAPSPAVSSVKSQCADSPSLGSDLHSEASADSGKAASTCLTTSMSPVEELIEVPPVYEFEVPKDIVGLLIGKKGMTIKWLTERSQAYIVIRDHFYSDKHKICTLEGTRDQINNCLRLIRRKFPPSRFPELRLTPIMPPPSNTPRTPVWDNVAQLNLPEGVNCEVAVSSIMNIGHVFLQQPTHPTYPSLTRLDQYMLAVYGQPAGVPPLPRPIDIGVICAAPVMAGWYRAQTLEIYEDTDEALVKFVDYGGYCRVSASDLRQIRSDFMTLPFQATECYLANISPVDEAEGWSQEALTFFETLCKGKVIEARVTSYASDNIPLVELYTSTPESKPVLVNRLLADRGYAKYAVSPVNA